jgi:hypothetical protein
MSSSALHEMKAEENRIQESWNPKKKTEQNISKEWWKYGWDVRTSVVQLFKKENNYLFNTLINAEPDKVYHKQTKQNKQMKGLLEIITWILLKYNQMLTVDC